MHWLSYRATGSRIVPEQRMQPVWIWHANTKPQRSKFMALFDAVNINLSLSLVN